MKIEGNHYVDYGLALDFSGNNYGLAVEVFGRLPKHLKDLDRLPAVMLGYGLANCDKGSYGVIPTFEGETELRTAKILLERTGKFDARDEELVCSGLPSRLGVGKRTLYTPSQGRPSEDNLGISWFGPNWSLDVYASDGDLADSYDDGWVVSVSREAALPGK